MEPLELRAFTATKIRFFFSPMEDGALLLVGTGKVPRRSAKS